MYEAQPYVKYFARITFYVLDEGHFKPERKGTVTTIITSPNEGVDEDGL